MEAVTQISKCFFGVQTSPLLVVVLELEVWFVVAQVLEVLHHARAVAIALATELVFQVAEETKEQ